MSKVNGEGIGTELLVGIRPISSVPGGDGVDRLGEGASQGFDRLVVRSFPQIAADRMFRLFITDFGR